MSRQMLGTGGIYKRGSTFWIHYSHRGELFRESSNSTEEKDAVRLLKRRLGEASRGRIVGPVAEKVTLAEMTQALLADYRLKGNRSIDTAAHFARNLIAFFGATSRAVDITSDKIAVYATVRQKAGLSNASINRETRCLRHMFNLMVPARLTRDHVPAVPRLEEAPPRRGFLEPADFTRLLDALPLYLRTPTTFLYLAGWRKGAMRSLQWVRDTELDFASDGTLVAGTIRLQVENSKNKRPSLLRLTGELLEVFRRAWENRRPECPFVFHDNGLPIGDFRKVWRAACIATGLNGLLVHDLRRSCARNLVRAGVPERLAMSVTGHLTRSMFDRYNIVTESDLESAMTKVSEYLSAKAAEPAKVIPLHRNASAFKNAVKEIVKEPTQSMPMPAQMKGPKL
jgi:integrase